MDEQTESRKIEAPSEDQATAATPSEFDRFVDLPIQAAVHLDRRRLLVRELLGLERESVIRLERSAGEDVDLMLNGTVVARGEIVVMLPIGPKVFDVMAEHGAEAIVGLLAR